ncbi:hypothetical protein RB195_018024 [Necator americanus]|uniref:Thioredoxin-like fold domain-containing protein n=1 Tax=Necator americanus TaxID=51031 RepID=A0ABR1CAS0_NECAM
MMCLRTDELSESSAGYDSRTSSTSFAKLEHILDDNGKGTRRVEMMPGTAHPLKAGQISKIETTSKMNVGEMGNTNTCVLEDEVRQILILPTGENRIHETALDELQSVVQFFSIKMDEYKEFLQHNSAVVFAVNYIQNQYISSEFCVELAKLFEVLNVKTVVEFQKSVEALQAPDSESDMASFHQCIKSWDDFIDGIEKELDEKVGPCSKNSNGEVLPELGIESKTIAYYVKETTFKMVLVVVVRSFNSPEVNQRIVALHNKMSEFNQLGCDVYLLTKGPPIGSRGGSYIKLIGVPFRKLYDENEAYSELKTHRRSAVKLAGWNALLQMVEVSLTDEAGPSTEQKKTSVANEDKMSFITNKGGAILVDQSGTVRYKYIEDETSHWPSVDEILTQVKGMESSNMTKPFISNTAKVDSETSAKESDEKKRKCCVIL